MSFDKIMELVKTVLPLVCISYLIGAAFYAGMRSVGCKPSIQILKAKVYMLENTPHVVSDDDVSDE